MVVGYITTSIKILSHVWLPSTWDETCPPEGSGNQLSTQSQGTVIPPEPSVI